MYCILGIVKRVAVRSLSIVVYSTLIVANDQSVPNQPQSHDRDGLVVLQVHFTNTMLDPKKESSVAP